MRTHISFFIHLSIIIGFWLHPPVFANTTHPAGSSSAVPNLSEANLRSILENPIDAAGHKYDLKDSSQNAMQSPSIIELVGQTYKYAAVYHTPYYPLGLNHPPRFKINLGVSNDLLNWNYIGVLIDNASMPRIGRVRGSDWLVIAHENWIGPGLSSTAPARITYRLFYNDTDLIGQQVRASWTAPEYLNVLNGTPSFYDMHLVYRSGYFSVDGQYGFHFWDGTRDANAGSTILSMFDPRFSGALTQFFPSTFQDYNSAFISLGASGNIGQRDTLVTQNHRYNIMEANKGVPGESWDQWKIWLYKFAESTNYPTGAGTISELSPITHGQSSSFGNPSISVVPSPSGNGLAIVVSYFLFSEGAAPGEAGTLIYYYNIAS